MRGIRVVMDGTTEYPSAPEAARALLKGCGVIAVRDQTVRTMAGNILLATRNPERRTAYGHRWERIG